MKRLTLPTGIKAPALSKRVFFFYVLPLLLTIVLVGFGLWPKLLALREARALCIQKRQILARYQAKIAELSAALKKEKGLSVSELKKKVFWGSDPYIIVELIQKRLAQIPELHLKSFRVSSRKPFKEGFERVLLSFYLEGDTKGLTELLKSLEEEPRLIAIKRLSVSRFSSRHQHLQISLEIEGILGQYIEL